ncbi:MarR family winged helix-turn-helix transcriptional regulator [Verticiella sediminum]|nr:MarR family transcriptional regulator [Verticiella sediminum]
MELEDHLFFLCTQVVYRRSRALQEGLKPLGLLETEYRVLSAVLRKGPLTMMELAQWTAYERSRVTYILNAMEARKWVLRTSLESDRRTVVVHITPAGREIFAAAKVIVDETTETILRNNTAEDLDRLRSTLKTMRQTLLDMEAGRR